jgi:HSP20 family protein
MKNISITGQSKRDLSIFQNPFNLLQYDIDSLFDRFASNINPSSLGLTLDVCDKGKEIIIKADAPGLDEKDISINLTHDLLTIQGEKKKNE